MNNSKRFFLKPNLSNIGIILKYKYSKLVKSDQN